MASAGNAFVAGFHSDFDSSIVSKIAERENVDVRKYTIIYNLLEDIKQILTGLLEAEIIEKVIGRAEVKQVFLSKKKEMIFGTRILSGKLTQGAKLKIIRGRTPEDEDNIVGHGKINSLRKINEQVKELKEGNECGIKYSGDMDIQVGDIVEAFIEEEKHRTIA